MALQTIISLSDLSNFVINALSIIVRSKKQNECHKDDNTDCDRSNIKKKKKMEDDIEKLVAKFLTIKLP